MPVEEILNGWGNYNQRLCAAHYPASKTALQRWVRDIRQSFIARGYGRSYGDSAVNAAGYVLHQARRNRFLAFDDKSGILTCEAGVSLSEIIAVFLPRGWFLPTTPGTRFVSVGGAIAADVHGKNHHVDGSWGAFVESLDLLLPGGEIRTCSRFEHERLFRATIGGMGLTGVILQAAIRLKRVQSAWTKVDYVRTTNLNHTFATLAENSGRYRYAVAWVDCLRRGAGMGRGVCMFANDAGADEVSLSYRSNPLLMPPRRELKVPFNLPGMALNPFSAKAFNTIYYAKNNHGTRLVDYDTFFYPLDSVANWNRIYGSRGFVQYQAFLPVKAAEKGYRQMLEIISASGLASFLAVLKSCGSGGEGMLSFLDEGYTLALDLPNTGDTLRKLTVRLDRMLIENGGRLYLAKDALTSSESFAAMYPRLSEFKSVKDEIDPMQQLVSDQARRLGIVEAS